MVAVDPQYYRPTEVELLIGDSSKARQKLNWEPKYDLQMLCSEMVQADIVLFEQNQLLKEAGFEIKNEYLNTASADFGPTFYGNNSVVYSSARRDIQNARNNSVTLGNQPFISRMDANGYLESPVLLKSSFGGAAAEWSLLRKITMLMVLAKFLLVV